MPHPLHIAAPAALLAALCSFVAFAGDAGSRGDHTVSTSSRGRSSALTCAAAARPAVSLQHSCHSLLRGFPPAAIAPPADLRAAI